MSERVSLPAVSIVGLHYQYPGGVPALRGVDLDVAAGERVALVGPNGAGKSTLLLHLNGILRGEGEVRVFGRLLTDANVRDIRSQVGLLFVNPDDQLFSRTVFEDVAYGPLYMGLHADEVRARSREALAAVGMEGFDDRPPHQLSIGQKRRVAIATVLSMGTPLLALDEPSASLDPASRRGLIRLLAGLPNTMLVASHDLGLVRDLCSRIVLMDEGRIVADGPARDVLADGELLEAHGLERLDGAPALETQGRV
jgi:cobalt/nickel transport system ATP-binding protein